MAGVSTKEIKTRIRSMEATRQITRAMEMVAASKLRHAQAQALSAQPYFEILSDTIADIAGHCDPSDSPYLTPRPVKKTAFVVIAGDRGLAGGFNSNLLKLAAAQMADKDVVVLPIGRKAVDFFKSRASLLTEQYIDAEDISVGDCFTIAKELTKGYLREDFDEVFVFYTKFVSVLSQTPDALQLLPLMPASPGKSGDILYEPDAKTVFDTIVPEYFGGVLYGALCESRASEQAARRAAMDAATQNADEMIDQLSLKFNQARQSAITQEITEIVAGS